MVVNMNIKEEVAEILLDVNAVTLRPNEPYRFTSGILSPIYTDCRILISLPDQRKKIINYLANSVDTTIGLNKIDLIAGTATAAIPHAAWISEKFNLPMVYIRSSKKEHGKQNQIEGIVKKDNYAVVIEDLVSTGGSAINSAKALREEGAVVESCFSIFHYGFSDSIRNFKEQGITLYSLTDTIQLLTVAVRKNLITDQEKKIVEEWVKNPNDWKPQR
jgi:orotate phosphoribosyltransferase